MGLKPGIIFDLADKVEKNYDIPQIDMSLEEMELIALENRPELAESRYQERISQKEITAAKLKLLPGINLSTSLSYENSDYLLNNDWYSYGANVSWNLLNVFKANEMNKLAKTQVEVVKEQNLALSMAVLSQVHLSIIKFNQAKKEYLLAKDYLNVADDIYKLVEVENGLNINSRLVLIKEKLNHILATLRYSSSYANVQNSYGRIFASIGVDKKIETPSNNVNNILAIENPKVEEPKQEVPVVVIEEPKQEVLTKEQVNQETPIVEEAKNDSMIKEDDFYNKKFSSSIITIFEGEKLLVNNEEYMVKANDDISTIAKEKGVSISSIVIENFWLVEKNRVSSK